MLTLSKRHSICFVASTGYIISEQVHDFKIEFFPSEILIICILFSENYELYTKPFRLLKLTNLISDNNYVEQLIKDLHQVDYINKDNDLYSLKQSVDLNNCTVDTILDFIHLLRSKVEPLLASVMGVTFNGTLSVTASMYKNGDVLLCHDDRCDDRCVAFVYYLTESTTEAGGHFRMFDHDVENGQPIAVCQSVPPVKNSFICFEVGNYTYHEVGEVMNNGFERLSINGWFHSDRSLNLEGLNYVDPMPQLYKQTTLEKPFMMDEFLNRIYCLPGNVYLAHEQFETDSTILLDNFFISELYNTCSDCLKNADLSWQSIGPANRRKYECADLELLPSPIDRLIEFLKSPMFISYLKDITGLDLIPRSKKENESCTELLLQLQRWAQGSYTMATDNDAFFHKSGLDLMVYFNTGDFSRGEGNFGGCTTYLASGEAEDGNESNISSEDGELITIEPQDNALVLIYRTSDTVRFTKYVNHFNEGSFHVICATYFEA